MKRTLYDALQAREDFTDAQLKRCYERLVEHLDSPAAADQPDRDAQRFAVREAWSVLGNPVTRAAYDERLRGAAPSREIAMLAGVGPGVESSGRMRWLLLGAVILLAFGLWQGVRSFLHQSDRWAQGVSNEVEARRREAANQVQIQDRTSSVPQAETADARRQREYEAAMKAADDNERAREEAEYADEPISPREAADAERRAREDEAKQAEAQRAYEARRRLERDKAELERLQEENNSVMRLH